MALRLLGIIPWLIGCAGVVCWAQDGPPDSLVLSPEQCSELNGARLVDAEGAPGGKAILIEEAYGRARWSLNVAEEGPMSPGLYDVTAMLGSADGTTKWAVVQRLPVVREGWYAGFARGEDPGRFAWRRFTCTLPFNQTGQVVVEVASRGDEDFHIGEVVLERADPFWPEQMMSDAEFFGGLDRNYPGLGQVIAAADAGDYDRACSELVRYFQAHPRAASSALGGRFATEPSQPTDKPPGQLAQMLLEDNMVLAWDPTDQSGYCTAERHKIEPTVFNFSDPNEWHGIYDYPGRRWYGWFVTPNLNNLVSAYTTTGDPRYARKAMDLLNRWRQVWGPFPRRPNYDYAADHYPNPYYTAASWGRTGTAHGFSRNSGVRHGLIEAMWQLLKATAGCSQITDRERIEALKQCLIMTRFVQTAYGGQNAPPNTYLWLLRAGDWLPEFREIRDMSETALYSYLAFMDDSFFPDGAYFELCYYRHHLYVEAAEMAREQGKDIGQFLDKFRPRFDFNLWMTKPMGNFPWINDAGGGQVVDPAEPRTGGYAAVAMKLYPDDPHLKFIASFGSEGEPPAQTSRNFDWSGFMIMRSGWKPEDLHLVFDGCRNTGSHNHMDQMNIVVSAYGSTLLCDAGYPNEFSAPERFYYFNHPRSHNLVIVDDLTQTPRPVLPIEGETMDGWRLWGNTVLDNYWVSTEGHDYAETYYDRPYRQGHERPAVLLEHARQERRILFLKPVTGPPYWVVYDIVQPKGEQTDGCTLQALFHFTPTSSGQVAEDGRAMRNTAENAGLMILPVSDKQWQARIVRGETRLEDNYWQGFVSGGYGKPPVPADCGVLEYNGPLPAAIATVLYPYPRERPDDVTVNMLVASREDVDLATDEAVGLEVKLPAGRDMIALSVQPGAMTSFGDLSTDGRVVAVRFDAEGRIAGMLLVDGSLVRLGQTSLIDTGGRRVQHLECGRGQAVVAHGVNIGSDHLQVTSLEWGE